MNLGDQHAVKGIMMGVDVFLQINIFRRFEPAFCHADPL